jgi:hypothetical protein
VRSTQDAAILADAADAGAPASGDDAGAPSNEARQRGASDADAGLSDAGAKPSERNPSLRFVAPRVVYVHEARELKVFGADLDAARADSVRVDGQPIGAITVNSESEGRIALPGLDAGEHTLALDGDVSGSVARLVAVPHPRYGAAEIPIPGRPDTVVYDPERGAFFGVFYDLDRTSDNTVGRIRCRDTSCQLDLVQFSLPTTAALSADGRDLLVLNQECVLAHVDPDSLSVQRREYLTCGDHISYEPVLLTLADGQTFYTTGDGTGTWHYPDRTQKSNSDYAPLGLLSQDGTRSGWLGLAPDGHSSAVFIYDTGSSMMTRVQTLGDSQFSNSLMSLSADGRRFMHGNQVYEDAGGFRYVGSLDSSDAHPLSVALSDDGTFAVSYSLSENAVRVYDVQADHGPFPARPTLVQFPSDPYTAVQRFYITDDGHSIFGFISRVGAGGSSVAFSLVVRVLE